MSDLKKKYAVLLGVSSYSELFPAEKLYALEFILDSAGRDKSARIAVLEGALMNIEEYVTHVPLHLSSDSGMHRERRIKHFVNQILEYCKAKGGE